MTTQMILALGVLIFMIVLIMTDALPFGAPPLLASLLVIALGLYPEEADPIAYGFAGFTSSSVWMVAFFMVVVAGFTKTRLTTKIQDAMLTLVDKGGFKSYVLLIVLVMLGTSAVGGGNTGWYMLILSLVTTLPYNEKMPTSKLLLPLGCGAVRPLLPINIAIYYSVSIEMLNSAGVEPSTNSQLPWMLMAFLFSVFYLIWSIVGYRVLPDHRIASQTEAGKDKKVERQNGTDVEAMPQWKEYITVACMAVSVLGMIFINNIGTLGYILPGFCAFILLALKVIDWTEFRMSLFSPIVLMMCCAIPVANALADSGFTAMVGNAVAGVASGLHPFFLTLILCFLTSTSATLTGANFGSAFVFAPIAAATCIAMGIDPTGPTSATVFSAWAGGYLPIDGLPAMIYGMGNYTMKEFWKYMIPLYIFGVIAIAIGGTVFF